MTETKRAYIVAPTASARPAGTKKPRTPRPPSKLEELLALQLRANKIPAPKREWRFHKTRMWRFDFAWPDLRIAVECEGGTFSQGRHTRGTGYRDNCTKYNAAALEGWMVLRYDMAQIKAGEALQDIINAIAQKTIADGLCAL